MPNRAPKNRPQLQSVDLDKAINSKPLTSEKSQRMDHATLSKRPAAKEAGTRKIDGKTKKSYSKSEPGYSH